MHILKTSTSVEIATELHNEFSFGHVKFVKVQYLWIKYVI